MKFNTFLYLFFLVTKVTFCARILAIFPAPMFSHQSVFQPIWKELSLRGHQVTAATPNPLKNASLTNLTEIDWSFIHDLVFEDFETQQVLNTQDDLLFLMKHMLVVMNNITEEQMNHSEMQNLIKSEKQFDLVIVEAHFPAYFGLAQKYNCPLVLITSMPATNFLERIIGNIKNPILTPSFNLPFITPNFFQRVTSVAFEVFEDIYYGYFLYPEQEKIIRNALNDKSINIFETFKKVSLLITTEIPGFTRPTMTLPSVLQVNGLQIKPHRQLPQDLDDFISKANQGIIFFSLGSNVKSFLISKERQQVLLKVFETLPFKVLWKFEEEVDGLPDNVKVIKWAPQQDILRHNKTKLFITQGGLQSIDEAIRFKVPILAFPFFGDQFYNSLKVESVQIGSWMNFKTFTAEELKRAILETADNQTYLRNLEELADLMVEPLHSLEKAVWWIEYVLRHNGAYHLRSPLADMPFYKYYLVDIFAFFLVCFVIFIILVKVLRKAFRKLKGKNQEQKVKQS